MDKFFPYIFWTLYIIALVLYITSPKSYADTVEVNDIAIGDMVAFDLSCDYFEDLNRRHPIGKCYFVNREKQAMFFGLVKSVDPITNKVEIDVYGTQTTRWGELRLNQFTDGEHIFKNYPQN